MFVVKQCCCGCSLKNGSIMIGAAEAVFSILGLAGMATIVNMRASDTGTAADSKIGPATIAVWCIVFVLTTMHLILAILLCCGASHENPKLIKPWIIYSVTSLVFYIVFNMTTTLSGVISGGLINFAICAVAVVLQIYFITVVSSYHRQLTGSQQQVEEQEMKSRI